jgi:hypothetical protein
MNRKLTRFWIKVGMKEYSKCHIKSQVVSSNVSSIAESLLNDPELILQMSQPEI